MFNLLGLQTISFSEKKCRQKGFTLLEILIAVFILAIIGVIILRGLQIVVTAKDGLTKNSKRLNSVQLSMTLLSHDIRNIVNRPILEANGMKQPALILRDDAAQTLAFTRDGIANPFARRRSTLQRVAYQLIAGDLIRLQWPVLDRVAANKPIKRVLLKNVIYLKWEFIGKRQQRYPAWPAVNAGIQALPKAVQMTLTIRKWGTIKRLFILMNPTSTIKKGEINVAK